VRYNLRKHVAAHRCGHQSASEQGINYDPVESVAPARPATLRREGKIQEIARYCETDVVNKTANGTTPFIIFINLCASPAVPGTAEYAKSLTV
jgi:hypothetical protein